MSEVYIANPQQYAGRVDGSAPSFRRLEPVRLPPAVTPGRFAAAFIIGAGFWPVLFGLILLLEWFS